VRGRSVFEVGPVEEAAGGAEGGGAGTSCPAAGSDRAMPRSRETTIRHDLQCTLGISVFILGLC
jgi:hypothetical protein